MKDFDPVEAVLQFGNSKPTRLIFRPKDGKYMAEEMEVLEKFKQFCRDK